MQQEKGLLCQMDKNEARVLGEDEQAGCHNREDLESPEGSGGPAFWCAETQLKCVLKNPPLVPA